MISAFLFVQTVAGSACDSWLEGCSLLQAANPATKTTLTTRMDRTIISLIQYS
jgi:hypothetical protein